MLSIYLYLTSLDIWHKEETMFFYLYFYISNNFYIYILYRRSHLAPDPIRSFMISKLPDSAQSWSAVFPFTDLRFTSAPMSIRYLPEQQRGQETKFLLFFSYFFKNLTWQFWSGLCSRRSWDRCVRDGSPPRCLKVESFYFQSKQN